MSLYLPEPRALFIHIPRTGGTWVRAAVKELGIPNEDWQRVAPYYRSQKHTLLSHFRKGYLDKVDFIFSFVRDPVDYYIARWRWKIRMIKTRKGRKWGQKSYRPWNTAVMQSDYLVSKEFIQKDFNQWAKSVLENSPCYVTRLYDLFVGPKYGEFCHFIGRKETLVDDFCHVMSLLGYEKKIKEGRDRLKNMPYINTIKKGLVSKNVEMSSEVRDKIRWEERLAINRFYGPGSMHQRYYASLALTDGCWRTLNYVPQIITDVRNKIKER